MGRLDGELRHNGQPVRSFTVGPRGQPNYNQKEQGEEDGKFFDCTVRT
jgi:hypothetical protein